MTQEDKDLLLKDLCARLHTNTMVNYNDIEGCDYPLNIKTLSNFPEEKLKCYLRPISSISEEERATVEQIAKDNRYSPDGLINNKGCDNLIMAIARQGTPVIMYLYSRHFDVMGLIEKGLALPAPPDMYKID